MGSLTEATGSSHRGPGVPPSCPRPRSLSGAEAETAPFNAPSLLQAVLPGRRLLPHTVAWATPPSPNPGRAPRYLALGITPRGPGLAPRRHGSRAGHAGSRSSAGGGRAEGDGGRFPAEASPRLPAGGCPGGGGAVLAAALPAAAALFAGGVRGAGAPPVAGSSGGGQELLCRCPRRGGLGRLAPEGSEGPRRFRPRSCWRDPPLPLFFACWKWRPALEPERGELV